MIPSVALLCACVDAVLVVAFVFADGAGVVFGFVALAAGAFTAGALFFAVDDFVFAEAVEVRVFGVAFLVRDEVVGFALGFVREPVVLVDFLFDAGEVVEATRAVPFLEEDEVDWPALVVFFFVAVLAFFVAVFDFVVEAVVFFVATFFVTLFFVALFFVDRAGLLFFAAAFFLGEALELAEDLLALTIALIKSSLRMLCQPVMECFWASLPSSLTVFDFRLAAVVNVIASAPSLRIARSPGCHWRRI